MTVTLLYTVLYYLINSMVDFMSEQYFNVVPGRGNFFHPLIQMYWS